MACALLLLCQQVPARPPSVYPVKEYAFDAVVDHYSYVPTTPATFPLRYYVNDEHYVNGSDAPVLFYTGNEADIFEFINNTGYMFELGEQMGALVVFAEHRYYGLSNPFGNPPTGPNPSLGACGCASVVRRLCPTLTAPPSLSVSPQRKGATYRT